MRFCFGSRFGACFGLLGHERVANPFWSMSDMEIYYQLRHRSFETVHSFTVKTTAAGRPSLKCDCGDTPRRKCDGKRTADSA